MFRKSAEETTPSTVPPLHYQHCREDVRHNEHARRGLPVVDAAEAAGVSVWKALATVDGLTYYERLNLAEVWKDRGRGPAADRDEFFA